MLDPENNRLPDNIKHIYIMGICGAGMSALAGILKSLGFYITGSDNNPYPPMSDFLASLNIPVFNGYKASNLWNRPDLVVVGNVIRRDNPEVSELFRMNIPYLSFPQAIQKIILRGKKSIVIAGTHGKTTTTSLVGWILKKAGLDPGFIAGGIAKNFDSNFRLPNGPYFVIEGDEYDSAFFDKRPKFFHYEPLIAVITSIEFDHADIYKDISEVISSFRGFIDLIHEDGVLIYNKENRVLSLEANRAKAKTISYGIESNADWYIQDIWIEKDRTHFTVYKEGEKYMEFSTNLYGRHNILNMLAGICVADYLGIEKYVIYEAIQEFKGVKRRLDHIGEKNGVLVIDDFAHHPTAVRETIRAVKVRFPKRRLIAVFEPRSNSSRRNIFQSAYALSFDMADVILVPEPPMMDRIPKEERFSSSLLVKDLRKKGYEAYYFSKNDLLLDALINMTRSGDVVLFMSNGIFDNLPYRFFSHI